MPVKYSKKTEQFHLYNDQVSYIFHVLPTGVLGHVYYGQRLPLDRDYTYQKSHMNHVLKVFTADDESLISYEDTLQELPVYGRGDFREEALRIHYRDGSMMNQFLYRGHEVVQGVIIDTSVLPQSMPNNKDEATTLIVTLKDDYRKVTIEMFYTIYEKLPVITRRMKVINNDTATIAVDKCASLNLDFSEANYSLMKFDGAWARERHVAVSDLPMGMTSFGSTKGNSSANHNPNYILLQEGADEDQGCVYGLSLIYSGNFEASLEINQYHQLRAQIGINPSGFNWQVEPGCSFLTPEAVMTYSNSGLSGLSKANHSFIKCHILPKDHRKEAQVLINNWEATYFDFDEATIIDLAAEAKELGANLFVLDDGWFVGRKDDYRALGDWFVDEQKLPNGIRHLSDEIHKMGLDFGLWIEPEMINLESKLYEQHPEWVVGHSKYSMSVGRHQYLLDFSNPEVVDYIHKHISSILREANVDYVKWDMNRVCSEPNSMTLKPENQGEFGHRFILGVYDLYKRLTSEFNQVTFESCASGGARFDLGMLAYAVQTWTSDNTDPVERLSIQTGTSYLYPLKSMGSHVSAKVNHQTLRKTSLLYKSHVAIFGTYGLELDVRHMEEKDKKLMREQIALFKAYKNLIHEGDFYRLISPFTPNGTNHNNLVSWMVVDQGQEEVLVGVYQTLAKPSPNIQRLYLKGLDKEAVYREQLTQKTYSGIELMTLGYILDDFFTGIFSEMPGGNKENQPRFGHGDFTSKLIMLTKVK